MKLHCYICDNINQEMLALHRQAAAAINIEIEYYCFAIEALSKQGISPHKAHGLFIEQILKTSTNDVEGFIDVDCLAMSKHFVEQCEQWAKKNNGIVGVAQCANHLPSKQEIYAAPAFAIVSTSAWKQCGEPSLAAHGDCDTMQLLSRECKKRQIPLQVLMPSSHYSQGKSWPLADKGQYGIGTIYGDGEVFHLFQASQGPSYVHLLEEKVRLLQNQASSRNESSS
jgi:hypothetical protein